MKSPGGSSPTIKFSKPNLDFKSRLMISGEKSSHQNLDYKNFVQPPKENLSGDIEHCFFNRDKVSLVAQNKSGTITDTEVLDFYNLATSKLLGALEVGPINVLVNLVNLILLGGKPG